MTARGTSVALRVIEAGAYHRALLGDIKKAKKRIVLAAMILVWGERTAPLFDELKKALERGVKVEILIDNYSRLAFLYNLQPRRGRAERVRQTFATLEELSRLGAKVYCFGKIGFLPHKGRCHVKISVVDDNAYAFGGINMYDQGFDRADYMLLAQKPEVAECLAQLVRRIGRSRPRLPDAEELLSAHHSVLFDGGEPGHSIIYDKACELTSQSKHVTLVSQYTPSGKLSELLQAVDATCYYNRPEQLAAPDTWGQAFDQSRHRQINSYKGDNFIHAKFMLFELGSGKRAMLTGSHNFSYRGVAYGTQEMDLYTDDPLIYADLERFVKRRIAV